MPDLNDLRVLGDHLQPPPLDALRAVSRTRRRHGVTAAVAACCTVALLTAGAVVGAGGASDSDPEPAPSPTIPSRATPSELIESTRPDGVHVLVADTGDGPISLTAGRYAVHLSGPTMAELDVPGGWEVSSGRFFHPNEASRWHGIAFILWAPGNVVQLPAHSCRNHTFTDVGPSVADLVEGLARQPFFEVGAPTTTTIGGVAATHLVLTAPAGPVSADCQNGRVVLYRTGRRPGEVWVTAGEGGVTSLWILELKGVRYVIHAQWGETARDQAWMTEMVRSITFSEDGTSGGP